MPARIAAGLLAVVILVSGCAQRAFVFLEQDRRPAQLEKDQAECAAEAKENTRPAEAVRSRGSWRPPGTRKTLSTTPSAVHAQHRRGYQIGRARA